jgi:uncharacterized protein YkwD
VRLLKGTKTKTRLIVIIVLVTIGCKLSAYYDEFNEWRTVRGLRQIERAESLEVLAREMVFVVSQEGRLDHGLLSDFEKSHILNKAGMRREIYQVYELQAWQRGGDRDFVIKLLSESPEHREAMEIRDLMYGGIAEVLKGDIIYVVFILGAVR